MNQTVYILIGLIGAGKSTWARDRAWQDDNTVIISGDDIRTMLHGRYLYDNRHEALVYTLIGQAVTWSLFAGYNVIIDDAMCTISGSGRRDILRTVEIVGVGMSRQIRVEYIMFPHASVDRRMDEHRGLPLTYWQRVYSEMLEQYQDPDQYEIERIYDLHRVTVQ